MHEKVARFGYSLANSVKMISAVSQSILCIVPETTRKMQGRGCCATLSNQEDIKSLAVVSLAWPSLPGCLTESVIYDLSRAGKLRSHCYLRG